MQVGFSQRIQLEWLEQTASWVREGLKREEIRSKLETLLRNKLSIGNDPKRGNRDKAVTILLRIWVSPTKELQSLRDRGLELVGRLPEKEHLAVHWGMVMATYPFFYLVAENVGRVLRLQGSVSLAQVQQRLGESLGGRETVARAGRRVTRCFVDWGVLKETAKKGLYEGGSVLALEDETLSAWLVEATLFAGGRDSYPLEELAKSSAMFPFSYRPPTARMLEKSSDLRVYREGLNSEIVVRERLAGK